MKGILRQLAALTILCLLTVVVAIPSLAISLADKRIMDLKNPDPAIRAKAAYDLGCACNKPARVVPPLMNLLNDPVATVRSSAATSLGAFQAESGQIIPLLLERLSDEDVEVRRSAIVALGMLGSDSQAAEQAVARYLGDPDAVTKTAAIVAHAAMGEQAEEAIPTLMEALGSKDEGMTKAARKAIANIGREHPDKIVPSLVAVLSDRNNLAVVNAVRSLGDLRQNGASAAPQLAAVYDKVHAPDRHYVVDALLAVDASGEHAIPVLSKSLRAIDQLDRREALLGLMRYRSNVSAILPCVTIAFGDASQDNRLLAIGIVRSLKEQAQAAAPALLPLTRQPDAKMRKAAVGALGSIRASSPEVIAALEKTISDQDLSVRLVSVYAFRRISEVGSDKLKQDIGKILVATYKRETENRMKQALNAALLPGSKAAPAPQHSKLTPGDKQVKPEGDATESQESSQ